MKINFPSEQMSIPSLQTGNSSKAQNASFSDFLNNALNQVNSLQINAEKMNEAFAAGLTDNIHQVMVASEKASVAMQFTLQVRNKMLDAYTEIMRMPI